jgi:hypothetical protein
MPSSPPRRAATRRSPRAAAAPSASGRGAPARAVRPLSAPFAAVLGLLVAVEDVVLAWLVSGPQPGWDWVVAVPASLTVPALVGAVLVYLGRAGGWLVLAVAAFLPVVIVVGFTLLFAALGSGELTGAALLLLPVPLGALVLAVRRPIREWTRRGRGIPPPAPARPGRAGARGR